MRRVIFHCLICCFIFSGVIAATVDAGQKQSKAREIKSFPLKTAPGKDPRLESELERYLGIRYKLGGTNEKGLDCSGFSHLVYKSIFGVEIPHNAASQFFDHSRLARVDDELKTGDLLFFGSTPTKNRISHVGIYLSDGKFIHAARRKGIMISSLEEDHWRKRVVSAKRYAGQETGYDSGPDDVFAELAEKEMEANLGYPGEMDFYRRDDIYGGRRHLEYDYAQSFLGDAWNIHFTPFSENVPRNGLDLSASPASLDEYSGQQNQGGPAFSYGIKVSSDIKPFDWMSITPSYTSYEYVGRMINMAMPTRTLEFDISFGSLAGSGWSLLTELQYATLDGPSTNPAEFYDERNDVDMSLTYSRKLSDQLQFSLIGRQSSQSFKNQADEPRAGSLVDQRFLFTLNFTY